MTKESNQQRRSWTSKLFGWPGLHLVRRILILELGFLAAAGGLAIAPWCAGPPDTHAEREWRWATVNRLAQPQLPAAGPAELVAARNLIEASSFGIEYTETRSELRLAQRRAIELLEKWSEHGGGVGEGQCIDYRLEPIFDLMELHRLALKTANSPSDPRFVAAIRSAIALRDRGGVLAALISQATLKEALLIIEERDWPCPEVLYEQQMSDDMVLPIIAREVICKEQWHRDHESMPSYLIDGYFEQFVAAITFDQEREHLYVQAVIGERLQDARFAYNREELLKSLRAPPRIDDAPSFYVRESAELEELAIRLFKHIDNNNEVLRRIEERDAQTQKAP